MPSKTTDSAGQPIFDVPQKSGFGSLTDQSLEGSNASPVDALTELGLLQKFFPTAVSAVKVSLGVQDDLNNLIK